MSAFVSNTKLVKCPFDPRHVVVEPRLQRHIIKCRQKHPNHVRCPFNAEHCFFTRQELDKHILECKDKIFTEPWRYIDYSTKVHGDLSQPIIHVNVPKSNTDEDWDSEY